MQVCKPDQIHLACLNSYVVLSGNLITNWIKYKATHVQAFISTHQFIKFRKKCYRLWRKEHIQKTLSVLRNVNRLKFNLEA